MLPNLKSSSLILFGKLCDDYYKVELDKKIFVKKDNNTVFTGTRNVRDGVWYIPYETKVNYKLPNAHPGTYE